MTDKNIDEGKGRLKEATGTLTGNDRLKNEGRADYRDEREGLVARAGEVATARR